MCFSNVRVSSDDWMVRPNVEFLCDVDEDPFLFMEDNDKVYGKRSRLSPSSAPIDGGVIRFHHLTQGVAEDDHHVVEHGQR